jgi:hypothetical protein
MELADTEDALKFDDTKDAVVGSLRSRASLRPLPRTPRELRARSAERGSSNRNTAGITRSHARVICNAPTPWPHPLNRSRASDLGAIGWRLFAGAEYRPESVPLARMWTMESESHRRVAESYPHCLRGCSRLPSRNSGELDVAAATTAPSGLNNGLSFPCAIPAAAAAASLSPWDSRKSNCLIRCPVTTVSTAAVQAMMPDRPKRLVRRPNANPPTPQNQYLLQREISRARKISAKVDKCRFS